MDLFQCLDDKNNCVLIYSNGNFSSGIPEKGYTWKYAQYLKDKNNIEYAYLYAGKDLDYTCPEHLRNDWQIIRNRGIAYLRSFREVNINLNEYCFFDLVPKVYLKDFCEIKNKICEYAFNNYKKPYNYDFLLEVEKMITDIRYRKLKLNFENINENELNDVEKEKLNRLKNVYPFIGYDLFGHINGRLKTISRNYFPILNFDKRFRKILEPNNNYFIELDYNAADGRVMLSLLDKKQPEEDLHNFHIKEIFGNGISRDEAKKRYFAYLYNPKSNDENLEKIYNKKEIVKKYFNDNKIKNIFGREIESNEYHALNRIIASTQSDNFLRQAVKVNAILEGKKSFIVALQADSILIDYHKEDKDTIKDIVEIFAKTNLGYYLVNKYIGKNYGEMRKV